MEDNKDLILKRERLIKRYKRIYGNNAEEKMKEYFKMQMKKNIIAIRLSKMDQKEMVDYIYDLENK